MTITRRSLLAGALVGGAAASTGLLSACAKGADSAAASSGAASGGATAVTGSAIPSASQMAISAAELTPFAPFAWQEFNGEALFAMGGCTSQVAEPGELFRIFQTINAQSGNPADPGPEAFDAYCQAFGAFGDQRVVPRVHELGRGRARHRRLALGDPRRRAYGCARQ